MTDTEKILLIKQMIADFYGAAPDEILADVYSALVEMISTVAEFGGTEDD